MAASQPLRVAILWHMHQPNYQKPSSSSLALPWVRLHALKDYLDMPLTAAKYENIRLTFNLVPSLLDQIQLYLDGGTDRHLELSRMPAVELTDGDKREILDSFFAANPANMIEPHSRFQDLYRKYLQNAGEAILPTLYSSEEIRDLQVWSNLTWIDPMFRHEEPVRGLFDKGRHFSEEEKHSLLDWQLVLMRRVVSTYQNLYAANQIDISFTPYYHPILPLLCDTESARESLPHLTLPKTRFRHPEDAEWHVRAASQRFERLFQDKLKGMWPSEGSISEAAAEVMVKCGIQWSASDEEVLYRSFQKSGQLRGKATPHTVYSYKDQLRLIFRDRALSDRIGFVYSSWAADEAVTDFIGHLQRIRHLLADRLDTSVVPIILDGENAWEYFPNDGREFLNELYQRIERDPTIQTVTFTEAASGITPIPLSSLYAGSWINGDFRIWIGHPQDNTAWDLLTKARQTVVDFENNHTDPDVDRIRAAWQQIYIAEGSDWCWWYGDDHRGAHNTHFDSIYREHLMAVYRLLDLPIPVELYQPIYRDEPSTLPTQPDTLFTPIIDGYLTNFYEWAGSGEYVCLENGQTMHRALRYVAKVLFGYDQSHLFVAVLFLDRQQLRRLRSPNLQVLLDSGESLTVRIPLEVTETVKETNGCQYAFREVCELSIPRMKVRPKGYGKVSLTILIADGENVLQTIPAGDQIEFELFEPTRELFWP